VLFGTVGVWALDMKGKVQWKKDLGPFPTRHGWGTAASPVAHGNKLFVPCDNDDSSFLLALDKKTGKELWRVAREEKSTWATPHIWVNEKRTELVTSGMTRMRSYDPESGKLLWELGGPLSHLAIPSPFSADGLLYMMSGYTGDQARPVFAIKPGASGDITLKSGETSNAFVAWSLPQGGPYNVSPIVYNGIYYTFFDNAFIAAHDAKTGAEIYPKRRIDEANTYRFTASPWASNGKLFALAEDGTTMVIQAGPEFKLLGKNLLEEQTLATPAISRGSLIIRTATQLYRISKALR
jgi:outer membrane protein assembly factor BamB